MNTKALRQKVLDLAIHGKLVPQNPNDESATVLLEKIRAEKAEKITKGELKADKKDSFIFVGSDKRHYEQFADGTVKDIEDEIPFDIPEGWAWCRLPEITEYIFAGGDKPSVFSKEKTDECFIPIYSNGIENDGLYGFTDKATAKETSLTISARGTIGFTCIRTTAFVPIIRLITITPNNDYINIHYLKAVFDSLFSFSEGSSIPQLTVPTIKQFLIPLPPFNEQKNIYSSITKIETIIQTLEQNKNDLKISIKQTKSKILDLAIHGKLVPQDPNDEPAEELLKRIATSDNRPYKKLSGDEIPFELPKTWIWQKLPDLCSIPITDGTHKTPTYSDKENGIPFLSSKDVTSGEIDWSKIKYITKELHEELYKRLAPQKNDILLAKNGTTGIAALVKDNTVFDIYVTLAIIRPISKIIYPQYLLYIINSQFCKNQFNDYLTGIGVPNLHLVDINKTVIPLPPLSEQQRIVLKIEELFKYTDIININIKDC